MENITTAGAGTPLTPVVVGVEFYAPPRQLPPPTFAPPPPAETRPQPRSLGHYCFAFYPDQVWEHHLAAIEVWLLANGEGDLEEWLLHSPLERAQSLLLRYWKALQHGGMTPEGRASATPWIANLAALHLSCWLEQIEEQSVSDPLQAGGEFRAMIRDLRSWLAHDRCLCERILESPRLKEAFWETLKPSLLDGQSESQLLATIALTDLSSPRPLLVRLYVCGELCLLTGDAFQALAAALAVTANKPSESDRGSLKTLAEFGTYTREVVEWAEGTLTQPLSVQTLPLCRLFASFQPALAAIGACFDNENSEPCTAANESTDSRPVWTHLLERVSDFLELTYKECLDKISPSDEPKGAERDRDRGFWALTTCLLPSLTECADTCSKMGNAGPAARVLDTVRLHPCPEYVEIVASVSLLLDSTPDFEGVVELLTELPQVREPFFNCVAPLVLVNVQREAQYPDLARLCSQWKLGTLAPTNPVSAPTPVPAIPSHQVYQDMLDKLESLPQVPLQRAESTSAAPAAMAQQLTGANLKSALALLEGAEPSQRLNQIVERQLNQWLKEGRRDSQSLETLCNVNVIDSDPTRRKKARQALWTSALLTQNEAIIKRLLAEESAVADRWKEGLSIDEEYAAALWLAATFPRELTRSLLSHLRAIKTKHSQTQKGRDHLIACVLALIGSHARLRLAPPKGLLDRLPDLKSFGPDQKETLLDTLLAHPVHNEEILKLIVKLLVNRKDCSRDKATSQLLNFIRHLQGYEQASSGPLLEALLDSADFTDEVKSAVPGVLQRLPLATALGLLFHLRERQFPVPQDFAPQLLAALSHNRLALEVRIEVLKLLRELGQPFLQAPRVSLCELALQMSGGEERRKITEYLIPQEPLEGAEQEALCAVFRSQSVAVLIAGSRFSREQPGLFFRSVLGTLRREFSAFLPRLKSPHEEAVIDELMEHLSANFNSELITALITHYQRGSPAVLDRLLPYVTRLLENDKRRPAAIDAVVALLGKRETTPRDARIGDLFEVAAVTSAEIHDFSLRQTALLTLIVHEWEAKVLPIKRRNEIYQACLQKISTQVPQKRAPEHFLTILQTLSEFPSDLALTVYRQYVNYLEGLEGEENSSRLGWVMQQLLYLGNTLEVRDLIDELSRKQNTRMIRTSNLEHLNQGIHFLISHNSLSSAQRREIVELILTRIEKRGQKGALLLGTFLSFLRAEPAPIDLDKRLKSFTDEEQLDLLRVWAYLFQTESHASEIPVLLTDRQLAIALQALICVLLKTRDAQDVGMSEARKVSTLTRQANTVVAMCNLQVSDGASEMGRLCKVLKIRARIVMAMLFTGVQQEDLSKCLPKAKTTFLALIKCSDLHPFDQELLLSLFTRLHSRDPLSADSSFLSALENGLFSRDPDQVQLFYCNILKCLAQGREEDFKRALEFWGKHDSILPECSAQLWVYSVVVANLADLPTRAAQIVPPKDPSHQSSNSDDCH